VGFSSPIQRIATTVGGSTTPNAAFGVNPTTGNLVVVVLILGDTSNTTLTSLKDGNGNSYTINNSFTIGTYAFAKKAWVCSLAVAPSNANKTLTATFPNSVGAGKLDFAALEVPVAGGTASYDTSVEYDTATAANIVNLPSITPSGSSEFLYAVTDVSQAFGTFTAGSPWTLGSAALGGAQPFGSNQTKTDEWINGASAAQAVSWTLSGGNNGSWAAVAAAFSFSASGAAAPTVPNQDDNNGMMIMLGFGSALLLPSLFVDNEQAVFIGSGTLPSVPVAIVYEAEIKIMRDWVAIQETVLEQQIATPVIPPIAYEPLETSKFDATTRLLQYEESDFALGIPGTPPVTIDQDGEFLLWCDWHAVYDHISETDEPGGLAAPPTAIQDEISERWSEVTRVLQPDDLDNCRPPTPIVVINTATDDLEAQFHAADKPIPAIEDDSSFAAPLPPVVQEGRFGLAEEEITVGDVMDFGAATAPPFAEDEPYKPGVISLGPNQLDDLDSYYPPTPIVVINTAVDDLEAQFKLLEVSKLGYEDDLSSYPVVPPIIAPNIGLDDDVSYKTTDKPVAYDHTSETDEPGQLSAPPSAIDQDAEHAKWTGWAAPAIEEDLSPAAPRPPFSVDQDAAQSKWSATSAMQHDDTDTRSTSAPTPPSAIQDEVSERFTDSIQVFHDDTDTARALPPTPFSIQEEGEIERMLDWKSPALEEDLSSATPRPPFAVSQDSEEAKWIAWLTPALEDDWVAQAPRPPVIEEISIEEASEKWIGWSALQPETIEQSFLPPTPPSTVDQDTEQSKWLGWIAPALEDDWHTFPPTPPVIEEVSIEEVTEKWVGWSALQPEELELDTLPPTPPPAIQDEVSERFTDTRQVFHDDTDTQRAFAPTPPLSIQESEDFQKWLAWASPVVEDDQSYVPFVPTSLQEEPIERWTGLSPAIDAQDLDSYYPPPPPPVVPEGWEFDEYLARAQDRVVPVYEDAETQRALPPTPPTTDQVDELQQKNVDWSVKQQDDTETQRGSAPTPPLSIEQDTEQAKVVGWNAHAIEDDATALPPTPPSAVEQDTEQSKYVDWSKPAIEDDARVLPPTPPPAIQDEISERFRDDRQVFHDDTESQRDLPPTPPLTPAEDDVQLRADWKAPALEDDHSFTVPTPPVVGPNDADSLLWSATASIQPDDLDSYYPPVPPIIVPTFGSDDIPSVWTGWVQVGHDDTETQNVETPQPPTAIEGELERFFVSEQKLDEELEGATTPPPPPVAVTGAGFDDLEAQFKAVIPVVEYHEDSVTEKTPTPPQAIDDDLYIHEQWIGWKNVIVEDVASRGTPAPPFAIDQDAIELLWHDLRQVFHTDEETQQNIPPIPPFAIQDDAEWQKFVGWVADLAELFGENAGQLPPPNIFMRICSAFVQGQMGVFNIEQGGRMCFSGIAVKLQGRM
jgi:hypothetical protein